jgi:hypothetical protein
VFRNAQYLNHPRCGLTIRPRAEWLAVEHCPRCLARRRTAVNLFASTLPADELYGERETPADDEQTEGAA